MKDKISFTKTYECLDDSCKFIIDSAISTTEHDTKEMPLTRKKIEIKEFSMVSDREIEGWISTRDLDWSGDIMIPEGVILDVYQKNPSVFFNHDSTKIIGKCVSLIVSEYGVKARMEFADTDEAYDCLQLAKGGFLNTFSVGFIPVDFVKKTERKFKQEDELLKQKYPEYKGGASRIVKSWAMLEFSLVGTPDNPNAVITQKQINDMEIKSSTLEMLNLKCSDCDKANQEFKEKIAEKEDSIESKFRVEIDEEGTEDRTMRIINDEDRTMRVINLPEDVQEAQKIINTESEEIKTLIDSKKAEVVEDNTKEEITVDPESILPLEEEKVDEVDEIDRSITVIEPEIDRSITIISTPEEKAKKALIVEKKQIIMSEIKALEKEYTKRGKLLRY